MERHGFQAVSWRGLVRGEQNEARNHRTFCSLSSCFRPRRFRAGRIKQDTGPRDAVEGLQERQPWRFRLCSGTRDASEGIKAREPGRLWLRSRPDNRFEPSHGRFDEVQVSSSEAARRQAGGPRCLSHCRRDRTVLGRDARACSPSCPDPIRADIKGRNADAKIDCLDSAHARDRSFGGSGSPAGISATA